MTLTLILQVFKLLVSLASYFQSRGWIEQGRKEEREEAYRELVSSLSKALAVEKEVENATDEEIDAIAEGSGWYRD